MRTNQTQTTSPGANHLWRRGITITLTMLLTMLLMACSDDTDKGTESGNQSADAAEQPVDSTAGRTKPKAEPEPEWSDGTIVLATENVEDAIVCKVTPPKKALACTMQYVPVCGCDDVTYANACSARAAGVPRITAGECPARLD